MAQVLVTVVDDDSSSVDKKKQKQNTTRIINDTTRKQTHEFTIWKLYYFVCLNYSPMLSTNLQSSNLITQRVKIKFHG